MDAVAPGLGADVDDRQADALGCRVEDLVGPGEADAHGIDEDVAVVGRVEVGLAADGGHAGAIAVAADAGDDAGNQVARPGVGRVAEAQGVEVGDRARAHGEDVAHDAADAGGGALVGLDVGGVVVALHLEDDGVAIADVDHARVLAGPLDHLRALGGKLGEPHARGLVRAVLAPHHREDAKLGQGRLAAEDLEQPVVLAGCQAMLGDDLGGDGGLGVVHWAAVRILLCAAYTGPPPRSRDSRLGSRKAD